MHQLMVVKQNRPIAGQVFELVLEGDTRDITMPGQFVNISLPGFFLRRPISVCDWQENELKLIYKVVGKGTDYMSSLKTGTELDILSGLGHGFDVSLSGDAPLLVGGGVGTPPMYGLAKRLVLQGKSVNVILGFASSKDAFYVEEFDALNELYDFGCEGFEGSRPEVKVFTATVDGSLGTKGFVTDCLKEIPRYSHYYACGPIPMLKALKAAVNSRFNEASDDVKVSGELSLEERMGCGFGACVGCSVMTAAGTKKVCSDGPVFDAALLFD